MSQYDDRKAQLVRVMKEHLSLMQYGFWFTPEHDGPKYFYPIFYNERHEEYLSEVFLTECGDVAIITTFPDWDGMETSTESEFSEFSNEEMETIMRLCGVEIPQEGEFYIE